MLEDPWIGRTVGDHRIERRLGGGAMATVYRATTSGGGRAADAVAIKLLGAELAARPEAVRRFVAEADALARVRHPGVVAIHGAGEVDGRPYLVMELCDGETLAARLARGRLSPRRAGRIARALAVALAAAHRAGVVHRDLKPDNVLLVGERPTLIDFGLARLDAEATTGLVGTPAYMAPEQALGRPIDARCDVYALGVVLFEMLVGEPPFRGTSLAALIEHHATGRAVPLGERRAELGPRWGALVDRARAREPGERFADMAEMERSIAAAMRPRGWQLGGVAAAAVGAIVLVAWPSSDRAPASAPAPARVDARALAPASASAAAAATTGATTGATTTSTTAAGAGASAPTSPGRLRVLATPWAAVEIDGRAVGTTPLTRALPPGTHVVVLRGPARTVRRTVVVRQGHTATVRATLAP